MSKQCAKCEKTVYPIEELKCLDKIWHKSCFKCWTCGMTLNMKNYKGYDKKPYCNAHYPTTKFTAVKETPEMQRIAQNTKLQSQVQYHKDFENDKGKFTVIADDPETKRLLSNTQKTSLVKYHEEFERSVKGVKTSVTDDPELMRYKKNTAISSEIEYRGVRDKNADMETRRGNVMQGHAGNGTAGGPPYRPTGGGGGGGGAPGSIRDYNPLASEQPNQPSPYSARGQGHQVYNSTTSGSVEPRAARQPGSISDYDPMAEQSAHNYSQAKQWQESVPDPHSQPHPYGSSGSGGYAYPPNGAAPPPATVPMVPLGQPLNVTVSQPREAGVGDYYPAPQQQQQPPPQQQHQAPPPQQQAPPPATGQRFRCVYDYTAGDSDEVSFLEEDIIVNPDPIDEGWMYGTVLRTGQRGMLPANYVEPILA